MNKIMPTIYTLLALSFLALALQMVISDFQLRGFNKVVLVSVSSIMAGIMVIASLLAWKNAIKNKPIKRAPVNFTLSRFGKVLFASYGVAFSASIIIIVLGMWIFGFKVIDHYIINYWTYILLVLTGISMPFVNKYLL